MTSNERVSGRLRNDISASMLKTVQAGLLAVLATAATCGPARATLFTSPGAIQTYDVAASGLYDFTVLGAQGGASVSNTGVSTSGGLGASAEGSVHLTAGDILDVIVGGMGGSGLVLGGGGGGGSFVYDQTTNTLLFAAGGGGGAVAGVTGSPGLATTSGGGAVVGQYFGNNGNGGSAIYGNGSAAGGAGWLSDGARAGYGGYPGGCVSCSIYSGATYDGGGSGNIASAPTVYGGNGGAGEGGGGSGGGGGGSGYSGGAGYNYGSAGGGGGSYVDASVIDPVLTAGFNAGDGAITIAADAASVPEPTSIVLIGAGLSCLGALRRRAK